MTDAAPSTHLPVRRIVSGGQTGADRAALDVARELGLDHGGWCPHGRRAEDGVIDPRYNLQETRSRHYRVRTRRNVLDSDGTLIVYRGELTGGTELTLEFARQYRRPHLLVELPHADVSQIRQWLRENRIETLNVAGPRESTAPGVYNNTRALLCDLLAAENTPRG